jgi:hypothetical protein
MQWQHHHRTYHPAAVLCDAASSLFAFSRFRPFRDPTWDSGPFGVLVVRFLFHLGIQVWCVRTVRRDRAMQA